MWSVKLVLCYNFFMSLNISATIKNYPKLPYEAIKDKIMGKSYKANLVFIGPAQAKKLNQKTRKKSYVPNVLSFPLDGNNGEIYITPAVAKVEAKKFNLSIDGYVGYLFIHGLLHLKGLDHSDKMDQQEQKFLKLFQLS